MCAPTGAAAFVLDWKSVAVNDGNAVAVSVNKKVEKTVRVLKDVSVDTWVRVRGVKAVRVTTLVLVFGTHDFTVLLTTRVVLSVRVDGVKVVMMLVVVRTKVRVVVSNVVITTVVVRTSVVVVKVVLVRRLVLVMVRVELMKLVAVWRSRLVMVRVLVWGKVKMRVRVRVLVVVHVSKTVVVALLVTVMNSSHWPCTASICINNSSSSDSIGSVWTWAFRPGLLFIVCIKIIIVGSHCVVLRARLN